MSSEIKAKKVKDWIVIDFSIVPNRYICKRCGASEDCRLPAPIAVAVFEIKFFIKRHRLCKEFKNETN